MDYGLKGVGRFNLLLGCANLVWGCLLIRQAVTSPEIYDDFDRYVRLFNETFKFR